MAFPKYSLQSRYKFVDYNDIPLRIENMMLQRDPAYAKYFGEIIRTKRFIPAGNTITTLDGRIKPNCSILPSITDKNFPTILDRACKLWKEAIGIGFNLSETKDPVAVLRQLSRYNRKIDLNHRPQRGNIAILDIRHPRVDEFIRCKSERIGNSHENNEDIYNFNISVSVETSIGSDRSLANELNQLAKHAHQYGDPGLLYLNNLWRNQPVATPPGVKPLRTLVPCGEQGMYENETCNLGSINLNSDLYYPLGSSSEAVKDRFNFSRFSDDIYLAVRFLDNVVDLLDIPDEEMAKQTKRFRRIGLGVMGYADLLKKLGINYGDEHSIELIHLLGSHFDSAVKKSTQLLALERGGLDFCPSRRNITVSCIAPTGGITLLTGNRGYAIEPFFEESIKISPQHHLLTQATWQKYIENSISKTINLPQDTSPEVVKEIFYQAESLGCNSITVYRDGSHIDQPISIKDRKDPKGAKGPIDRKECPRGGCSS